MSEHTHGHPGSSEATFSQDEFLRGLGEVNRPLAEALDPYPDGAFAEPASAEGILAEMGRQTNGEGWNRAERELQLEDIFDEAYMKATDFARQVRSANAFIAIAESTQDPKDATLARQKANRVSNPYIRALAYCRLAESFHDQGDLDTARQLASELDTPDLQASIYTKVASESHVASDLEHARKAARHVYGYPDRAVAYSEITRVTGEMRDIKSTLKYMYKSENGSWKTEPYIGAVGGLMHLGNEQKARSVAYAIPDPLIRTLSYLKITQVSHNAIDLSHANEAFREVEGLDQRDSALNAFASTFLKEGMLPEAREAARSIWDVAVSAQTLTNIYATTGDQGDLDLARQAASKLTGNERAEHFAKIAAASHNVEDLEEARKNAVTTGWVNILRAIRKIREADEAQEAAR